MKKQTNIEEEPYITIVQNPFTGEFTLALNGWDIEKDARGYTKSEAQELIGLIERGMYHLNNCVEDYEKEIDGKETDKKEGCGCSKTVERID